MLELPAAGLLIAGWHAELPAEAFDGGSAGVCDERLAPQAGNTTRGERLDPRSFNASAIGVVRVRAELCR